MCARQSSVLAALAVSALYSEPLRSGVLDQLIGLVQLRTTMLTHWADDKKSIHGIRRCVQNVASEHPARGKWMYGSFLLAMLFAVIFIVGVGSHSLNAGPVSSLQRCAPRIQYAR